MQTVVLTGEALFSSGLRVAPGYRLGFAGDAPASLLSLPAIGAAPGGYLFESQGSLALLEALRQARPLGGIGGLADRGGRLWVGAWPGQACEWDGLGEELHRALGRLLAGGWRLELEVRRARMLLWALARACQADDPSIDWLLLRLACGLPEAALRPLCAVRSTWDDGCEDALETLLDLPDPGFLDAGGRGVFFRAGGWGAQAAWTRAGELALLGPCPLADPAPLPWPDPAALGARLALTPAAL